MAKSSTKAESYRVRAAEVRAIADTMRVADTREILVRVAEEYERMAVQVEKWGLNGLPLKHISI